MLAGAPGDPLPIDGREGRDGRDAGLIVLPAAGQVGPDRDPRSWLVRFGVVAMAGVAMGVIAAGLPPGRSAIAVVALLALAASLWAVGLDRRVQDLRLVVPVMTGVGLIGAALDALLGKGPAFVAGYMGMVGLALRAPRRVALWAAAPVLIALAGAEARNASDPGSAVLAVALGAGFLFVASAFAAVQRDARAQAEVLLAEQAALAVAREQAATMAERARLARELHDILAHTLSGLSVQLEVTRLTAEASGADPALVDQLGRAHRLARDGMVGARRAVQALRGEGMPGPDLLPKLVRDAGEATGTPIELTIAGRAGPLPPEAGLTVYRTVQEALTNVTKYAGRGAEVRVDLAWTPQQVTVSVIDCGGDGAGRELASGGFGLRGLAERAAQLGGRLEAGPRDGGFVVTLRLPVPGAGPAAGEPGPVRPEAAE